MPNEDKLLDIIFDDLGETIEDLKDIINQEEVQIEDIVSQQSSELYSKEQNSKEDGTNN